MKKNGRSRGRKTTKKKVEFVVEKVVDMLVVAENTFYVISYEPLNK